MSVAKVIPLNFIFYRVSKVDSFDDQMNTENKNWFKDEKKKYNKVIEGETLLCNQSNERYVITWNGLVNACAYTKRSHSFSISYVSVPRLTAKHTKLDTKLKLYLTNWPWDWKKCVRTISRTDSPFHFSNVKIQIFSLGQWKYLFLSVCFVTLIVFRPFLFFSSSFFSFVSLQLCLQLRNIEANDLHWVGLKVINLTIWMRDDKWILDSSRLRWT